MKKLGGRLMAVCTDPPKKSMEVVRKRKLNFPVLSDPDGEVLRAYGLLHEGGGLEGSNVAIPAQILIGKSGEILWRRKSERIQDRLAPDDVIEAIRTAVGSS